MKRPIIYEVANPDYKKAKRDKQANSPQKGTIIVTDKPPQKPLSEVIKERERRHEKWLGETNSPKKDCENGEDG